MYDWANSAFQTTVVTVLAGPYLTALAQGAVGENGTVLSLGPLGAVTAKALFPYCISLSVFAQVFLLPVLGAIADYTNLKKNADGAVLLRRRRHDLSAVLRHRRPGARRRRAADCRQRELRRDDRVVQRVPERHHDRGSPRQGLEPRLRARVPRRRDSAGRQSGAGVGGGCARHLEGARGPDVAGVGGPVVGRLRRDHVHAPEDARPGQDGPLDRSYAAIGIAELAGSIRELRRLPHTLQYLLAYMAFNDGIQTIISIASVFLAQELYVAKGLPVSESFLIGLILMVQFVAFFGSLVFERIAALIGAKRAILLSLVVWTGIVVYAYGFLQTVAQAWAMGAIIAVVLGGSQALSRSLFSQMIPAGRQASFFGLYEISERGTSWMGPLIFGIVVSVTNSYRQAILSLIVLFIAGMIVLLFTDTDQAIHDAGNRLPEEAVALVPDRLLIEAAPKPIAACYRRVDASPNFRCSGRAAR